MKTPPRRVGWWGKLPARGDFVGRGLPPRWRSDWDGWLQQGLSLAAGALDATELRERLAVFAPWRYLALPAAGDCWCGILVPSHDRVGRVFPLTLAERCSEPPAPSAARLATLLDAAAEGPEALEAAIAAWPPAPVQDLPPAAPWPPPPASLWWPLAAAHDAAPRIADWPPAPALLLDVLEIPASAHATPAAR